MEPVCVSPGLLWIAGRLGEARLHPQHCARCGCSPAVTPGPQTVSDAMGWPSPITPAGGTDPVLAFGRFSSPQLGLETVSQRKIKACIFFFSGAGAAVVLAVMMGAGAPCTPQAACLQQLAELASVMGGG